MDFSTNRVPSGKIRTIVAVKIGEKDGLLMAVGVLIFVRLLSVREETS